jgi:1-acyl-sn-glycerol-3-phosphate acyltransferase
MNEKKVRGAKLEPFYPARPSPAFQKFMEHALPWALRIAWRVNEVHVSAADLERLRGLRSTRAVFAANHPSLAEPAVAYLALRRAGVTSHNMTAWDTLTRLGWLSIWAFQRIGGYSIRRGRRDRAAIQETEDLLVRGERILLFPEGQTYALNDVLLPFQPGVLLMGLKAAEELEKQGVAGPLLIVPMGIKYVYTRPMLGEIDRSLAALEAALGLSTSEARRYDRLRRIAGTLVERMERENGLTGAADQDLNDRIDALRQSIAGRLAAALGIPVPKTEDTPTLVQALANAYEDRLGQEEAASGSAKPSAELKAQFELWLHLKRFLAVRDGYVGEWPSAERFLDVLGQLEGEVLRKGRLRGPRRAVVRIGEPFDLRPHLDGYRSRRREVLDEVTGRLEDRVRVLLDELQHRWTKPLPELAPA